MLWALHDWTVLYNRFWLPYGFLHSNETRDWLAYLRQFFPVSISMFWFYMWDWPVNLASRCAYSLLVNGWTRMQSAHQENRQNSRKIPCGKQRAIQLFIRNTDPAVWRTVTQRIYLPKAIRIFCIKSCNHTRSRTRICYYADLLSLGWKSGCDAGYFLLLNSPHKVLPPAKSPIAVSVYWYKDKIWKRSTYFFNEE